MVGNSALVGAVNASRGRRAIRTRHGRDRPVGVNHDAVITMLNTIYSQARSQRKEQRTRCVKEIPHKELTTQKPQGF